MQTLPDLHKRARSIVEQLKSETLSEKDEQALREELQDIDFAIQELNDCNY